MLKFLTLLFCFFFSISTFSQVITVDGIDEFTFERIKRSSFVELNKDLDFNSHICINQVDSSKYFTLKFMKFTVPFSIEEGMRIMFKLQSGEVITLTADKTYYSCIGCGHEEGLAGWGGEGIIAYYPLSSEVITKLTTNRVSKVRIYTSKGYVQSELEAENAKALYKTFELFKSNN